MNKCFDHEVERWNSLYTEKDPSAYKRYALFQKNARKRTLKRKNLCLRLLNPQPGMKILDLGCGSGSFRHEIVSKGASWTGLDVSFKMLCNARTPETDNAPADVNIVNGNGLSLPFRDSVFHAVLCVGMINFYHPDLFTTFLRQMDRVIRSGGTIVFTSLRLDILTWLRSRMYPRIPLPLSSPGPLYPLHYQKILDFIERSNFECVEMIHMRKYLKLPHYTIFKLLRK